MRVNPRAHVLARRGSAPEKRKRVTWSAVASLVFQVDNGRGRSLVMQIMQTPTREHWIIVAVENDVSLPNKSPKTARQVQRAIDSVLDDHSHASLTPQPTMERAMAVAELYAHEWLTKRSQQRPEACGCEEIRS
jgi:hypothetical protein